MLSILKNQAIKGLEGVLKGTYTLHNWVGGVGLSPPPMDGISEIIVFSGVSGPKLDAEPSYTEKKLCPPLENFCLRPLLPSLALDVQGCRVDRPELLWIEGWCPKIVQERTSRPPPGPCKAWHWLLMSLIFHEYEQ